MLLSSSVALACTYCRKGLCVSATMVSLAVPLSRQPPSLLKSSCQKRRNLQSQGLHRNLIIQTNVPAAGKKQCKPLCALTEEARRLTGNSWQNIYWSVLLKKKNKKEGAS